MKSFDSKLILLGTDNSHLCLMTTLFITSTQAGQDDLNKILFLTSQRVPNIRIYIELNIASHKLD